MDWVAAKAERIVGCRVFPAAISPAGEFGRVGSCKGHRVGSFTKKRLSWDSAGRRIRRTRALCGAIPGSTWPEGNLTWGWIGMLVAKTSQCASRIEENSVSQRLVVRAGCSVKATNGVGGAVDGGKSV